MTISLDERLVESVTAALEVYGVHLGRALGLTVTAEGVETGSIPRSPTEARSPPSS